MTDLGDHHAAPTVFQRHPLALLHVSGVLSLAAGAIHAAAIGAHAEHPRTVTTFAVLAVVQIGAGALALSGSDSSRQRSGAIAALAVSTVAVAGWILAKTTGIGFVEGLGEIEPIQFSDGLAAALAFLAMVTAALHLTSVRRAAAVSEATAIPGATAIPIAPRPVPVRGTMLAAGAVAILTVFGINAASTHRHEGTGEHDHPDAATEHISSPAGEHNDGHDAGNSEAVAPVPYEPAKPIDLGGVEGVSPEQQARAENLVAVTLARLPQFADWTQLEAKGFHSIQDEFTGYEHFMNWSNVDDGRTLDPDYPESVVFEVRGGTKTLVSAMFMSEADVTLDDVPDIGGPLTQWHIHNNLCYFGEPPVVAGVTNSDGSCRAGTRILGEPRPMIHVWIRSHQCGPFAALEGIGAGQVTEGETHLCDSAHGSHHS